ncbi:hypothetical protein BDN72DRAFT_962005 [Pluteus cervinus]|uniref:Uncharacterized protein n=1 Tax=Pluteus cervinus TaxID=181527 RepID=A0ACD3AKR1_9AGAR|nr:hypothetical protein BDN72DRAFT_962005 [Pluteus cervinus]
MSSRGARQDAYDLRDQIQTDDHMHTHADAASSHYDDGEHSILEDDSDGDDQGDYMDDEDDGSSSLSIPNESIDFDLVYSLHSFAATVEGQANVVKGDSLFLMDDSNSYWWLVRVLKTQEVGYIPAENIETPFERLARLNKHRNVDLASATQAELQDGLNATQDRLRNNLNSRAGNGTPSPVPRGGSARKGVVFTASLSVHRYPPAVWNEEEEEDEDIEWDDEPYEDEDPGLAEEQQRRTEETGPNGMEPDDGMGWDDAAAEQARQARLVQQQAQQAQQQAHAQQQAQQQQQLQQQKQRELLAQQQQQAQQQQLLAQQAQQAQQQAQSSRENLQLVQPPSDTSPDGKRRLDPAEATETRKVTLTNPLYQDAPSTTAAPPPGQPLSPSVLLQQQQQQQRQLEEERKRAREEEEEIIRKRSKNGTPVGSAPIQQQQSSTPQQQQQQRSGKLRKEPSRDSSSTSAEDEGSVKEGKKKKSSVFGRLFGGGKDKEKNRDKNASTSSVDTDRTSEESSRVVGRMRDINDISPTTAQAMQQQNMGMASRNSSDPRRSMASGTSGESAGPYPAQNAPSTPQQAGARPGSREDGREGSRDGQGSLPGAVTPPQVSQHASQLRQRDQQQQLLYQQYLNRSPSSPPELQPSYGLQSASAIMPSYMSPIKLDGLNISISSTSSATNPNLLSPSATGNQLGPPSTPRPRPGSLILTPSSMDGPGMGVPELSVIRVFAGDHLDTEATFKTVLLNSSTTSEDLIRQAIQRFRLPVSDPGFDTTKESEGRITDESGAEYYLTAKQVELGGTVVLGSQEKPLVIFETLVEAALEMPKVKRSSVGSISSVASNLSMHPAIKKLPMNDFTDDSAVKFYLNRRPAKSGSGSTLGGGAQGGNAQRGRFSQDDEGDDVVGGLYGGYADEADETLIADTSHGSIIVESPSVSSHAEAHPHQLRPGQRGYLSVNSSAANNLSGAAALQERFMSPSFKFALQLVIYPGDLPDDMIFHPTTEAIVFKESLRGSNEKPSSGVSLAMRKKVFVFPRNATVAEVIELGLERFGILEGVVDGGDEVEDKLSKRRSSMRVRYCLRVDTGAGQEKELSAATRVIDAFPRPPALKPSASSSLTKRRSIDSANLLGSMDDVGPDDPIFVLRRATSYRISNSRHHNRMSAALDEIALQHKHRESASSYGSDPNASTAHASSTSPPPSATSSNGDEARKRQEILAQRNVIRANQRAILSTQTNSVRGMDVLLPGNALLRSSRYEDNAGGGDRMRYSYVQPDGETYDISEIVEEEWRSGMTSPTGIGSGGMAEKARRDLLEGLARGGVKDAIVEEKLERVLNRVKDGRLMGNAARSSPIPLAAQRAQSPLVQLQQPQNQGDEVMSMRSVSPASQYSVDDGSATEVALYGTRSRSATPSRSAQSTEGVRSVETAGRSTPTAGGGSKPGSAMGQNRRHPSIASVISDTSDYTTAAGTNAGSPYNESPIGRTITGTIPEVLQEGTPEGREKKKQVPLITPDAFGVQHMMALIEFKASMAQPKPASPGGRVAPGSSMIASSRLPPLEPADELLFGRPLEVDKLHPDIRDIYADSFKKLGEMDKLLDDFLMQARARR